MEPSKNIPKMEPMLSTEDRMNMMVTIIYLNKSITFRDVYKLSTNELTTLHRLLIERERTETIRNERRWQVEDDIDRMEEVWDTEIGVERDYGENPF